MKMHQHRCALEGADHPGPCVCVCGAIVEAVPSLPYAWSWARADGGRDPFPGPAWKPRPFDVGTNAGRFSR